MGRFEKGDRVKVTFEAQVRGTNSRYTTLIDEEGVWLGEVRHDLVTVEKVAPPMETFKPGDVLREVGGTTLVALGQEGYMYLNNWDPGEQFKYGVGVPLSHFTSRDFERVDIS